MFTLEKKKVISTKNKKGKLKEQAGGLTANWQTSVYFLNKTLNLSNLYGKQ